MARILVAGGAGFVGSHLVDRLIEIGHRVLVVDNFSSGKMLNLNPLAEVLNLDIQSRTLKKEVKQFSPHYVYYLIAQKSADHPMLRMKGVVSMMDYQPVKGFTNMLKACKDAYVSKVIVASSSHVYGVPKYLGVDELHPLHPVTIQGKMDLQKEYKLREFSKRTGMCFGILRLANIYGNRQEHSCIHHLFQEVDDCIQKEMPLLVEDEGMLKRDYIYISDAVDALVIAMNFGKNEIINIGSGVPVTSYQVINTIEKYREYSIQVESIPLVYNHVNQMFMDISKSRTVLDWHPEFTLHSGIQKMIKDELRYIKERMMKRSH